MQLKDIMTEEVEVIQPDTLIKDAAAMMRDLDVGVLPVTNGRALSGVLTDRDIVVRSTAEGNNPGDVRAGSIISEDVAWCYEDDEVETASNKMKKNKIRRLPIVNRENELVGIVSLGDLAVEADEDMAGETLEEVSKPNRPEH
jgi:CBS domain-containing protein